MEEYGLSQYIYRENILSHSDDQLDINSHQHFLVNHFSFSFQKQHQQQPRLHSSPFENEKDKLEQPTHDKTININQTQRILPTQNRQIHFSNKVIQSYQRTYLGTKNDTMELNINFKTILVGYFRELIYLKELTPQQTAHVQEFVLRAPSFHSLTLFYEDSAGNQSIRAKCLQFFSNGECIKRILEGRSRMKTKLIMIKFIQKMRCNLLSNGKTIKWKDNRKFSDK